jgi:hypothetical protein
LRLGLLYAAGVVQTEEDTGAIGPIRQRQAAAVARQAREAGDQALLGQAQRGRQCRGLAGFETNLTGGAAAGAAAPAGKRSLWCAHGSAKM